MKRICSWCGMVLGEFGPGCGEPEKITGGICPDCMEFFSKNTKKRSLHDFLESLAVPIVLFDGECRVQFANEKACGLIGKKPGGFQGFLGGDALQCAYARLPGGAGKQSTARRVRYD